MAKEHLFVLDCLICRRGRIRWRPCSEWDHQRYMYVDGLNQGNEKLNVKSFNRRLSYLHT